MRTKRALKNDLFAVYIITTYEHAVRIILERTRSIGMKNNRFPQKIRSREV